MAGKIIQFSESIPEQRSKDLVALPHAVFLSFDVGHSALVSEHKTFIKATYLSSFTN